MPIEGITNRPITNLGDGLPIIADGFKGAERTPEDIKKKRPGRELPHFRIKFRPEFAHLQSVWDAMYGTEPVHLAGAIIGADTVNDAFITFNREWAKTGIIRECDGTHITREYVPEIGRTIRQEEKLCLHTQNKTCDCKREGTLKLMFSDFSVATGVLGVVRFTTHSFEDIVSIYRALATVNIIYGTLRSVRFTIYREQGETSFFDTEEGIRKKMKKWFVKIRVDEAFVKATLRHRLEAGAPIPQLPHGNLPATVHQQLEADNGDVAFLPYEPPTPPITWIATNGNTRKILAWAHGWFGMSPESVLEAFQFDDPTIERIEEYAGDADRIRACAIAWYANGELSKVYDVCANHEIIPPKTATTVKRLAEQLTSGWQHEYVGEEILEGELAD